MTETFAFQAEVARLLEIVTHSLYSQRDIFLRELIANANDACERLRYQAVSNPDLLTNHPGFAITLIADNDAKTLTVRDNGMGMTRQDMLDNLGTIARSGTAHFAQTMATDKENAINQIGQFGMGFYSSFMVARPVTVVSRAAGADAAWQWQSNGTGEFTLTECDKADTGTDIILHLLDDAHELLDKAVLQKLVKQYSDHIAIPILFAGDDAPLNQATALWQRPRGDITQQDYTAFYHSVGMAYDDPFATLHWNAEGVIDYTALLYIPSQRPMDLFDPRRQNRVKLYVKRVFITDDCDGLLPPWLRFIRGVVDSPDVPLNVSREMLQHNPVLAKIRSGLVKKILGELAKRAHDDSLKYEEFLDNFGAVLKEGLYEDPHLRDDLLKCIKFASSNQEQSTLLADYVARMPETQEFIYYSTGDNLAQLRRAPQLEGFIKNNTEVLLLTDPIDEFWLPTLFEFMGKKFKSITKGDAKLNTETSAPGASAAQKALTAMMQAALHDVVKDVRLSTRLTNSAVCLIADDADIDIRLERLLKSHNQLDKNSKRILEINPTHPLIAHLSTLAGKPEQTEAIGQASWLLYEQARILEGEAPSDINAFARRLDEWLLRGLKPDTLTAHAA